MPIRSKIKSCSLRIKSHALFLTVVLSLVIFIFLQSFFFFEIFDRSNLVEVNRINQNLLNLNSASLILLKDSSKANSSIAFSNSDSLELKKIKWGYYEMGMIRCENMPKLKRGFFIGYQKKNENPSLYLSDKESVLHFSGNVTLNGTICVPYNNWTYENIRNPSKIQNLNWEKFNKSEFVKFTEFIAPDINKEIAISTDKQVNSFFDSTIFYNSIPSDLDGNFVVFNKTKIIVSSTHKLKNIILIAPVIIIKSGFEGKIQCLATDSIVVEQNCTLNFPSALAIHQKKKSTKNYIKIGSGSIVNGKIQQVGLNSDSTYILIEKNCKFNGEIVSNSKIFHEGFELDGQIFANQVNLLQPGFVKVNALQNVIIESKFCQKNSFLPSGINPKILSYVP